MLSVILLCGASGAANPLRPESIVRTLTPLVGAAVKGVVRDVVLAGPSHDELETQLQVIAEHAGCTLIAEDDDSERLKRAVTAAKGQALMVLEQGHVPEPGFFEEVEDLLADGLPDQQKFLLRTVPETFLEKLFPKLAPPGGLIVSRFLCGRVGAKSLAELISAIKPPQTLQRRLRRIA
jgi:hypothetical protein